MDDVDDQMRRILLARWLTRRATAAVGGRIPEHASRETLEAFAVGLKQLLDERAPLAGLRFSPFYPGPILVEASASGAARLVLRCTASLIADPLGDVFTVLIPGRRPEVSVAPPGSEEGRDHPEG